MQKVILLTLWSIACFGQTNTEVYLFDLGKNHRNWQFKNGKNISNNEGYDSQPHFYDAETLLFSSTRNGQTDIARYDLTTGKKAYINTTPNGGEYSPQRIPESTNISAVRLDKNGLQRFYNYDIQTGKSTLILKDLVVAYPMWYDKNTIISSVIVDDNLHLYKSNILEQRHTFISENTGRSFHKIPNTKLISFTKKNKDNWEVWSFDPTSEETKYIVSIGENEDLCWLPDGVLCIANGNTILKYDPKKDKYPKLLHNFSENNIKAISRITVNKEGTKFALVAETSGR